MQAAGQIPANIVADTPQAAVPVVGSTITRQARRYVSNNDYNNDTLNLNFLGSNLSLYIVKFLLILFT